MKILLTGATGFLGKKFYNTWNLNHEVIGIGRSKDNQIICDLSTQIPVIPEVEMVVHAAGLAHRVPVSISQEKEFMDVNLGGTANLLQAIQNYSKAPDLFVFISSVSVYGCETGEEINESFPLLANDAYGKSKIAAEKMIIDWSNTNKIPAIILRLPLVTGQDPPGNLGAMIAAIRKGYYFRVGQGVAKRSVVHALDVAEMIPRLPKQSGIYNLTASKHPSIFEIDTVIAKKLAVKIKSLPESLARILAFTGDIFPFIPFNSKRLQKLTASLTFSDKLARSQIQWKPGNGLDF